MMSGEPATKADWVAILVFGIFVAGLTMVRVTAPAAATNTASQTISVTASPGGTPAPGGIPAVPTESANHPAETAIDSSVKVVKAVQEFITAILTSITWPIVIAGLAWVFRDSVGKLAAEVINAMRDRSVTLDLVSVKVQVGERPISAAEDQTTMFSRSPLEIGPDPVPDRSAVLGEIPPQLVFQVSDYGAGAWANKNAPAQVDAMRAARNALKEACEKNRT